MSKNHVSIDAILKHRRSICNINEASAQDFSKIKTVFDHTVQCLENERAFDRNYNELIGLVTSTVEAANRSYNYPLLALEKCDGNTGKHIDKYCNMVVPKLDTDSLTRLDDTIDQYQLGDEVKDQVKKVVETYKIADRILNNHDNISERCDDIEATIVNSYRLGNYSVAEQVKGYIDTYQILPYQKMNLCLEEIYYVLGKNGISYDKSAMVRSVVESFLLSHYNENKENYIKVLENNYCYTEEDVSSALDALQTKEGTLGTIQNVIDEYLSVGTIPFIDLCINLGGCSIQDLKLNMEAALDFVWRCVNTDPNIDFDTMNEGINAFFETLCNKIAQSEELMAIEDAKNIYNEIKFYTDTASNKSGSEFYAEDKAKCEAFIQQLNLANDQFMRDCGYLYNRNNIDTMVNLKTEAAKVVTLQEFKKFRFSNLVKTAINLEKYIKAKAQSVFKPKLKRNKSKLKLKRVVLKGGNGSSLLFEDQTLESMIGTDGKADICVAQYYYNEWCEIDAKEFFNNVCKEFNKTIDDPTMKAYYIFNGNIAEVHLKENVEITLSEEEAKLVDESADPSMNIYIENLVNFTNMSDKLIQLDTIGDRIIDQKAMITNEQFELLVEALQYLQIDKKDLERFAEKYTEFRYRTLVSEGAENLYESEMNQINDILESYEPLDELVPTDIQIEAASLLCDILEAGIKKPNIKKADIKKPNASDNDDDVDDEEDEKEDDGEEKEMTPEEKSKIDDMFDPREGGKKSGFGKLLNGIRLGLKGLRAKMGDLGGKYREAGKNLDASADHFMKGMHDALISNRREAIIKGSVIPSFSRCINAGLIFAGASGISMLVAGTMMPAVIGALGAFAISKKLTKRERMLMLDELETELDVVEKEIQMAESKNQMKRYRALLRYKKDCQRQYQRIKYNHRIGKDLMPGSATGVYKPGGD